MKSLLITNIQAHRKGYLESIFFIFPSVFFSSLCFHADIFTIKSHFHLGQWHLVFKANKHETICFENMWVDDKVIRISEKCQRECQESQSLCVSYMKMGFGALCADGFHTVWKFLCFCWSLLSSHCKPTWWFWKINSTFQWMCLFTFSLETETAHKCVPQKWEL